MMQSNILFPRHGKQFIPFFLLLGSLVILTLAALGTYIGIFVHINSRIETLQKPNYNLYVEIPVKHIIPWESLTPVKDQGRRSTCWAFATVGFLEASYNYYAKLQHKHSNTSYVSFTEQVIGIKMVDTCNNDPDNVYCTNGQRKHNASDGLPEWLYYFNDVNHKWALPNNLCPYKSTEAEWDVCPDIDTQLNDNPVRFTVNNITTVYSIRDIKITLLETDLPLTWSHGIFNKVYQTECSRLSDPSQNEDCASKRIPCGDDYCYEIEVSAYDKSGVFDMTGKTYISGTHSMMIVGWNDDLRINRNAAHRKINEYSRGGFIIKNSWGYTGHSAGYWLSNHSTVQEDSLCPNFGVYQNWIPVEYECMKENFDLTTCANGYYRIVQLQRYNDGTVLKCSNLAKNEDYASALGLNVCALPENSEKELRFALQSERNSQPIYTSARQVKLRYHDEDTGQAQFYLIMWEEGSTEVSEIITGVTTYVELEKLFDPVVSVENTKYCGYYFLPYDVFKFGNGRFLNYGDDTIAFSSFDITWDDSSFLDNKDSKHNYEGLENEVNNNKFTPLDFKGPYIKEVPN
ncbi:Papain family cysteine protease domain containing protein [Entamoeba marina]